MASNIAMEGLIASMFVAKYGGIVVMSDLTTEVIFPLLAGTTEYLYRSAAANDGYRRYI